MLMDRLFIHMRPSIFIRSRQRNFTSFVDGLMACQAMAAADVEAFTFTIKLE